MREKLNSKNLLAVALLIIAVVLRLIPHMPNVAPITAIALFAGVYFTGAWAYILPLVVMIVSDIFLGFHSTMLFVYGSLILTVAIGHFVQSRKSPLTIAIGTLIGSILFFIITNFGVWLTTNWYGANFAGLVKCYQMAIPFFRNSLFGDIIYAAIFFGVYETFSVYSSKKINKEALWLKKS